ncbi:MAG: large conductance mechanosensitive channel protein MscL [Clostridia bacterium]|nr:large conductance mechanosensitive channel protein MscL [Clostridia bacterium]
MEKKIGKVKKFFEEFKKFITRGNVLDMAVGVIVGGAFTAIVNGMSNFILKPIINWILALVIGKDGLEGAITMLSPAYKDVLNDAGAVIGTELDLANSIYIDWGSFISAIINFLLIAFVLFMIVRTMNKIAEAQAKMIDGMDLDEKKAVAKIRREQKVSKKEAKVIYEQQFAEAAAKKAEEERVAAELAAADAAAAEAKAMANTKLLEEIRDLLKNK